MPTSTANGSTVPVGSDPYAPTADLKKAIEGVRSIIPIGSAAALANLPSLFGGTLPVPTFVVRTDMGNRPIFEWNGTKWLLPGTALGLIKQVLVPASSGNLSTSQAVINNITNVDFVGGRKYRFHWGFEYIGSVAGNYADFSIYVAPNGDSAGSLSNLTKVGGGSKRIFDATRGTDGGVTGLYNPTVDQTLQVKFTGFVWVGSGAVNLSGSGTLPVNYSVYDEGRQF